MADNYLEKKMEEYRAGRMGRPSQGVGRGRRVPYPASTSVVLIGLEPSTARAVAETLTALGAKVGATASCGIAAGCGVRIYPDGTDIAADLAARGESLTCTVTNPAGRAIAGSRHIVIAPAGAEAQTGAVTISGGSPAELPMLVAALASHASTAEELIIRLG